MEREGEWPTERRGEEEREGEGRKGEEERSGAFPRTVGPRGGVGCPALISACSGSGFPFSVAPKAREREGEGREAREGRGGRIMRETFVFFFFFQSGRNKKKKKKARQEGGNHASYL